MLEIEISQLLIHLPVEDVVDNWVLFDSMDIKVEGLHGIASGNLHDLVDLMTNNKKQRVREVIN